MRIEAPGSCGSCGPVAPTMESSRRLRSGLQSRAAYFWQEASSIETTQPVQQFSSHADPRQAKRRAYSGRIIRVWRTLLLRTAREPGRARALRPDCERAHAVPRRWIANWKTLKRPHSASWLTGSGKTADEIGKPVAKMWRELPESCSWPVTPEIFPIRFALISVCHLHERGWSERWER